MQTSPDYENPDHKPDTLADAIKKALNLPEEFQTEYRGDKNRILEELGSYLNRWDELLGRRLIGMIGKINFEDVCPHLIKAKGAEFLHYCQIAADDIASGKRGGRAQYKFSGAVPKKESAEFQGRCIPRRLEKKCTDGLFLSCEHYKRRQAQERD